MNNRKLKQLVKEALSNMIDEVDVDDLANKNYGEAMSENEGMTNPDKVNAATDIGVHGEHSQFDDFFEEGDMGGGVEDPDADALANQLMMMSDTDLEEETHSLREFFDLDEMAAPTKQYKLTGRIEDVERFLKLVNDKIKTGSIKKLFGRGSKQGRKPIPFSEEEIDSILNIIQNQETFTAKDFIGRTDDEGNQIGVGRFNKVQQPNAILKALSDEIIGKDEETGDLITGKNYIQSTMGTFVKNAEPDTSSEPKRRGRPTAPKSPSPEDEFDAPEMEPEMTSDDDPIVQQAMRAQAQAQEQDPKKQAVKSFMDQMKAMGVISDDNKVLDMDTYKDEFAKFKSTMNETLNESKNKNKTMKKLLLTERFQQLAGIKPLYTINSLNERGGATFNPELIQERDRDNAGMFGGWGDESLGLGKPVTEPSNLGLRSKADAGKTSLSYDVMMKSKDGSKNVQIFATVGDEPKLSYRANGIEDDVVEKWLEARKDDIQRYFSNMNYSKEELGKNFHIGGGYEDKVTDEDMKSIKDGISKLASVKIGKI
jgi:hypothetical protein